MSRRTAEIEAKWQERWYSARINESERDGRPKFMIIFAYPGLTGYLHVGHMRGYTYVDAIARYKRMAGFNVLFPVGTHATGNGAISLAKRVREKDPKTLEYLRNNGCPEDVIPTLTDPMSVVSFFNGVYQEQYWKRFGFLADWRRFTSTTNPDYGRFIQWQFLKLDQAGLLIQKPYYAPACVECGPVAIDASETDISRGGNAETTEYTLLKFRCGDMLLVAATLRPETVYGQVNFWANPGAEYVKVRKDGETWVVSRQSYEKMRHQKDGLELIGSIQGRELIGLRCVAPVIKREIPVLPASFVDPSVGTGLVTSVPSDAPDDWISLKALQEDEAAMAQFGLDPQMVRAIKPVPIIDTKGYGGMPAVEMIAKLGIERPGDPRLEELKKQIYKDGFHSGRMNASAGEFAGMRVDEAKELIKQMMMRSGDAEAFYDLSEEVACRCGRPVLIRRVDDQWFIDYADAQVTERTKSHCRAMRIQPQEYYDNVQGVLDWFRERACVRQGNWLGTRFPLDPKWTIEAISDSTLYPVYYLVSLYHRSGAITPEQMTEAFFDFALLGRGDVGEVSASTGIPTETLERVRADVEYWYPLDVNLGGKEHMTVHFPAFLMNHVAILPERSWPRGIFVNWYVTGKMGKISKSKGGAEPIPDAAERFGVDAMRLYYAHIAAPFADVAWDEDAVTNYASRMERVQRTVEELRALNGEGGETIDRWLISRMNSRAAAVREAMETYDLRRLANEAYFDALADLRWYMRRGGAGKETIEIALSSWFRMMAPITPHAAEELWESSGGEGFVSLAPFPDHDPALADGPAEESERYLQDVMSDVNEILRVTGISPKRVVVYTTPEWRERVQRLALSMRRDGSLSVPSLTKAVMADEGLRRLGKPASEFARKAAEDVMKRSQNELDRLSVELDELDVLRSASSFLSRELGCEVSVYSADDAGKHDPQSKSKAASPRRPAIYVE